MVLTGRNAPVLRQNPWQYGIVFPAGLSLSGHISAPAKLPAPDSDGCSSDFWLLSSRWVDAHQGERGKKCRKDTLPGVFALVDRWYPFHILHVLFGAITMSEKKKVLVAMSGGVDSSAAAASGQ